MKIRDGWVGHKRCVRRVNNRATMKDNGIQAVHFAIAKYWPDNFFFEVIDAASSKEEANSKDLCAVILA